MTLVRDLIEVLPQRSPEAWAEIASLELDKPTVILLSGFGATQRKLSVVRKRLLKDNFNVLVLALDWKQLGDGVKGLARMAERLSSLVLKTRKHLKTPIYLVAHSAGGLVAMYYLQVLGGVHYCERLVTLATPHEGTWFAALGFLSPLILKARWLFQMIPGSSFMKRLHADTLSEELSVTAIFSPHDLISPKGLKKGGRNVSLPGLSHSDFLMSKEAYASVLEALTLPKAEMASIHRLGDLQ